MLSKQAFMQWFREQVQGRWPRCAFTGVQVQDWYHRLGGFDSGVLTAAARRHYTTDEPPRPSLKLIHQYARAAGTTGGGSAAAVGKPSPGVPDAHTFIQCVGRDGDGRGPVGWFVPVLLWPFGRTYTRAEYDRAAEHQRSLHARRRGGVWEVVAGTTERDMRTRQYRLTGQEDRIRQNAEMILRSLKTSKNS